MHLHPLLDSAPIFHSCCDGLHVVAGSGDAVTEVVVRVAKNETLFFRVHLQLVPRISRYYLQEISMKTIFSSLGLFGVLCVALFYSSIAAADTSAINLHEKMARPGCGSALNVIVKPMVVKEDFSKGFAAVQEATGKSSHTATWTGDGAGVTMANMGVASKVTLDTNNCPVVNIEVGFGEVDLFVAAELGKDACAHDHVLHHERHHVELYREAETTLAQRVTNKLAPKMDEVFNNSLPGVGVRELLVLAMAETSTVMSDQNGFDSEEEYAKNQTVCDGAIATIHRRWWQRRQ